MDNYLQELEKEFVEKVNNGDFENVLIGGMSIAKTWDWIAEKLQDAYEKGLKDGYE